MAHRVSWSPGAIKDLEEIAAFIAKDSLTYAKSVVRKVVAATRQLAAFPNSGRVVPELGNESTRELFAYSYRIIYRVQPDEILVVAVVHGRRTSN